MMILAKIIINFIIIMQQYQYFLDSFNEILLNSFRPCASRGEILFPLRSALLLSELNNEGTHFISNTRPFVSARSRGQIKREKWENLLFCCFTFFRAPPGVSRTKLFKYSENFSKGFGTNLFVV